MTVGEPNTWRPPEQWPNRTGPATRETTPTSSRPADEVRPFDPALDPAPSRRKATLGIRLANGTEIGPYVSVTVDPDGVYGDGTLVLAAVIDEGWERDGLGYGPVDRFTIYTQETP